GLITILLFFAIPHELTVPAFKSGILLYVILISSLLMTWALVRQNRTIAGDKQPRESQPTRPPGETKTNENKEPDSNAPIY
ncbi:MAG: hypothetical protein KDC57_20945, partial [Saprospiraceae bacterium]|nr:hypothetical protein [Saprospiraceae bacterium]